MIDFYTNKNFSTCVCKRETKNVVSPSGKQTTTTMPAQAMKRGRANDVAPAAKKAKVDAKKDKKAAVFFFVGTKNRGQGPRARPFEEAHGLDLRSTAKIFGHEVGTEKFY